MCWKCKNMFLPIYIVLVVTICGVQCDDDRTDITARLIALENKIERQATQINDLQETVSVQKQTISDLTEQVAAQENDKRKITRELKELRVKSLNHERTLRHWMKAIRKTPLRPNAAGLNANDNEETTGIQRDNGEVYMKKRFVLDTVETVAFEATIADPKYVQHTHIHDRVMFDSVSLNVGNGYKPGNGTFIAPVGGIYIFSTSVMMHGANTKDLDMHVIIEKNNVEIAGAWALNQGAFEHSSVTAAMDLQPGDTVVVSVERHDDITFYGDRLTSFTGFLLYPF